MRPSILTAYEHVLNFEGITPQRLHAFYHYYCPQLFEQLIEIN